MSEKNDKDRGLILRILSNKDIQKGIAFFSLALILAFAAVIPVAEEEFNQNTIEEEGVEEINFPGYRVHNATVNILEGSSNLIVQDFDGNELFNESVSAGNSIDLTDLDGNRDPNLLVFRDIGENNLTYSYILEYSRRPYGLLSLPAAFLTLIGMVFAFKGKGIILGEIKSKQMEEKRKKEEREKEEKITEEKDLGEEVIFEKEDSHEEKGEADHINFMGVPKEDDEENKEG